MAVVSESNLDRYEERLREAVETFFRDLRPGDGASTQEIAAAEERLGCRLPAAVRRYFSLLGRACDLNRSHDSILAPEEVHLRRTSRGERLILASSHQDIASYGVPVDAVCDDDPPMLQIAGVTEQLAFPRISEFYPFEVLWQIVNDLAPFRANARLDPKLDQAAAIEAESRCIAAAPDSLGDFRFLQAGPCLILRTTEGRKPVVAVAAREEEAVSAYCQRHALKVVRLRRRNSK